jgi:hypothetical protein
MTSEAGRPDYEDDVDVDDKQALSRAEGGEPQEDTPDRNSTTGSTPSEDFVGRVAGDDGGGYEGETGAERRAAAAEAERSQS